MPLSWSKEPGAAPYEANLEHGLWHVSHSHQASANVELAYVRRMPDGRLPGAPLAIGTFSAAAEAMLAVEIYEANAMPDPVADLAAARGFLGPGSTLQLLLPGSETCLLKVDPDAVSLELLGRDGTCIGHLRRPCMRGDFTMFERPPGIEDPEALDASILLEILTIRRARTPPALHAPITIGELATWQHAPHPHR